MVKTIHLTNAQTLTTANTTEYWLLNASNAKSTTEANVGVIFRSAGVLSNLYARITANSISGGTSTLRTRKNATTDGNLTLSVGASATGEFEDNSSTDTVSAGDKWNYQSVPGAATGQITFQLWSSMFAATTNTVKRLVFHNQTNITTASTTWYPALEGQWSGLNTTENNAKCRMRKAGTFKNGAVNVTSNRATTSTVRLRKNGGNGNNTISITGGGATGWYEDTSSSDTVSAGEDWNWSITTGTGVDTLTIQSFCIDFESTNGDGLNIWSVPNTPLAFTDNTTRFGAITGRMLSESTESDYQMKSRVAFEFSELTTLVTQNDASNAATLDFRDDAGSTALTVSITASTTGVFSDSTHTFTSAAADELNTRIVVPTESGTHTVTLANVIVYTHITTNNNVERALGTETVTISDTNQPVRLCAKNRNGGTQTVTISEAAFTRLAAKNRALGTETVSSTEQLDRVDGRLGRLDAETVTITESSLTRLAAKIRTLSETPPFSESLNRLCTKIRSLTTETVTSSEQLDRVKGAVRALQDDITVGETLARLSNKIRTAIETTTIGETLARMCAKIRALGTETVTVDDGGAAGFQKGKVRTVDETVNISEQIARMAAKIRTASDTIIISEQADRLKAAIRSLATESVTTGESLARMVAKTRAIIENESIGESLNRLVAKTRAIIENTTVGESLTRLAAKTRALTTEVVAIADLVEQVVVQGGGNAIERIIEETVVVSDSVTRLAEKIRTVVETVDSTEDATRMKAANRSLSESESISDSVARLCNKIRVTIENTTVGESLTRLANKFRSLSETVVSGENTVRQSGKSRSLSESESIGESIARMCAKIRNPIETVSIGEALNRMTEKFRTLSESVTVNDTVARVKGVIRSLSDSITIGAGTVANMSGKIRTCIETVVSSESLARQCNKFRTFVETVTINDLATALKQGPIVAHLILVETVLVADMVNRFVSHIGIRPLGAGGGGRRMKRLVRRSFKLFK